MLVTALFSLSSKFQYTNRLSSLICWFFYNLCHTAQLQRSLQILNIPTLKKKDQDLENDTKLTQILY